MMRLLPKKIDWTLVGLQGLQAAFDLGMAIFVYWVWKLDGVGFALGVIAWLVVSKRK